MALPNETLSREEVFLKAAALGDASNLPEPLTRVEEYLKYIAENGSGGGGTSDYEQLNNLPQVNGTTLVGNKSLSDLGITQAIKKVADMIAGEFDVNLNYAVDDVVIYQNDLYIFTAAHTAGEWDSTQVRKTDVISLIGSGGTPTPITMMAVDVTQAITQIGFAQMMYQAFGANQDLIKLIVNNKSTVAIELLEHVLSENPPVFTIPRTAIAEITKTVFPTETTNAMIFSVECYGEANDLNSRRSFATFQLAILNGVVQDLVINNVAEVEFRKVAAAVEAIVQNENLILE